MLARYYIENDLICLIVLLCLAYQTVNSNFKKTNRMNYMKILIVNIVFAISDMIWIFNNKYVNYTDLPFDGITFGYIVNGINVCLSAISGWSWLYFSENFQDKHAISHKKNIIISLIPVAILMLLTATTAWTHFMFYITPDGSYVRQSGYALQMIIAYGYIIASVILSLQHASKATTLQSKRRSMAIVSFAIFPALACVVQMFYRNMSIIFIGTIIALLNVYITLQGQQVLNDPLTGLNNRTLLDQKIVEQIGKLDKDHDLWLLIMDANKFKSINDTYGHLEGDHALVKISDTLKKVCTDPDDFVCRYGGDEFVVLHTTDKGEDCTEIKTKINKILSSCKLPYSLSVSIGAAKYTKDMGEWASLIQKADEELYTIKKSRPTT